MKPYLSIIQLVLLTVVLSCSDSTTNPSADLSLAENNGTAFGQAQESMLEKHISVSGSETFGYYKSMDGSTYTQFTPEQSIQCTGNTGQITLKFKTAEFAKGVTAVYIYLDSEHMIKVTPSVPSFAINGDTIKINFGFDTTPEAMIDYFLLDQGGVDGLASDEYELSQTGDALAKQLYDELIKLSKIYQSIINHTTTTDDSFLTTYESLKKSYFDNIGHFKKVVKQVSFAPSFWAEDETNKWNSGLKFGSVSGSDTCIVHLD